MPLENGIVLPGITRESIIQLLTEHADGTKEFPLEGMPKEVRVVERDITMGEVVEGIKDGSLKGYVLILILV
jgi:branched-chain amino acid aminotransferase